MLAGAKTAPAANTSAVRRIAFVVPSGKAALDLHGPLFTAIADLGHAAVCLTPQSDTRDGCDFESVKVQSATFDPKPEGWSLLQPRRAATALGETLKDLRVQSVVSTDPETMLLTAAAAGRVGITNHIAIITQRIENGNATNDAWRQALATVTSAVFLNRDDKREALKAGLLPRNCAAHIVHGAGVDLDASPAIALPPTNGALTFFMNAGLGSASDSKALVEAARTLAATHPLARVMLSRTVGIGNDMLPDRVTQVTSADQAAYGAALAQCHVYVHAPGSEAMPQTLLEALATGRAIITANTAGCRETVDDFVNGCLLEAPSAAAIRKAMDLFMAKPELLVAASRASRLKAERRFDRREITKDWLKVLALVA